MKTHQNSKSIALQTLLTLALAASPVLSLASNSDATGGNETSDAQAYNQGKGVYAQKLACSNCPLAGKILNAGIARDLLGGKDTQSLSPDESKSLTVYLKRRFKL